MDTQELRNSCICDEGASCKFEMLKLGSNFDKVLHVHGWDVGSSKLCGMKFLQALVVRLSIVFVGVSCHVILHQTKALVVHAHTAGHIHIFKVVTTSERFPEVTSHLSLTHIRCLKLLQSFCATVNNYCKSFRRNVLKPINAQMFNRTFLWFERFKSDISNVYGIRDVKEPKVRQVWHLFHSFISKGILATTQLNLLKLRILLK